jgi:hypothetical protein
LPQLADLFGEAVKHAGLATVAKGYQARSSLLQAFISLYLNLVVGIDKRNGVFHEYCGRDESGSAEESSLSVFQGCNHGGSLLQRLAIASLTLRAPGCE